MYFQIFMNNFCLRSYC